MLLLGGCSLAASMPVLRRETNYGYEWAALAVPIWATIVYLFPTAAEHVRL